MRAMVVVLAVVVGVGGVVWGAEELTEAEREKLVAEVRKLEGEMGAAHQKGRYAEALAFAERALMLTQKLYPVEKYPDGDSELANCLNNLGYLLQVKGEFGKAESFYRDALVMRRKLYPVKKFPDGHIELVMSFVSLGYLLKAKREYDKAEPFYRDALAMSRRLYPAEKYADGHPLLAICVKDLGRLLSDKGEYDKAEPFYREVLAMHQKQYPIEKYPNGHPDLTTSLNDLGFLLKDKGEYGKAEPFLRDALAMDRKLYPVDEYPEGHSDLAHSLNNLGLLLEAKGEHGKAEPFYRDALAMFRKLYPVEKFPDGHSTLATSLGNMGYLLQTKGEYGKAEPFYRESLAMKQKLYPVEGYPDGHPDLALSLHNLGGALRAKGEHDKAEPFYRDALAMHRKLYPTGKYPDGHPDLIVSLNSLGYLLRAKGEYGKAEPVYREALAMSRRLTLAFAVSASEAELLNLAASRLNPEHVLLDVTATQPADKVDDTHAAVWTSKGAIARILARRSALQQTAATANPKTRTRLLELIRTRQDIARLAFAPSSPNRDESLRNLTEEKERLERDLASALPPTDKADVSPTDLAARLPKQTAFIDLFRYDHRKPGPTNEGEFRYAAFIVRPGKPAVRVELGAALSIDKDAAAWRAAILAGKASDAPARLHAALWKPLVPHLPEPGPDSVVYLSPAGDLHALPWAALPGSKPGSVLLEDTAVVLASGPDLLDTLAKEHKPIAHSLLTVGGVAFGDGKPWPQLPATADEAKTIADLVPTKTTTTRLADTDATPDAVLAVLPKSRWAHFATHGFFATGDDPLLDRRLFALGREGERISAVARNPLVQTGLVLADANAGDGKGMLTAEAIAGLDLRNLDLVVLSACETGLGENVTVGGEGVFGLQRAFHLAGTRNVVASLWKVDDEATAALMKLFYHGLWVDNLSPAQALRRAQLALLRHPDARTALAKTPRGPNFDKEVKRVDVPAAPTTQPFAEVRYWAAFTVSGVGR